MTSFALQLIMYPKASGRGIKASNLMKALCQLAGIQDVGIKIQVPLIDICLTFNIPARALHDDGSAVVQLGLLCAYSEAEHAASKSAW